MAELHREFGMRSKPNVRANALVVSGTGSKDPNNDKGQTPPDWEWTHPKPPPKPYTLNPKLDWEWTHPKPPPKPYTLNPKP